MSLWLPNSEGGRALSSVVRMRVAGAQGACCPSPCLPMLARGRSFPRGGEKALVTVWSQGREQVPQKGWIRSGPMAPAPWLSAGWPPLPQSSFSSRPLSASSSPYWIRTPGTGEAWLTCEVQAAGRKEQGVPACPVVQPSTQPHAGACCVAPGNSKAAGMKPELRGHQSFMGLLSGKP